jgi:hypothetical protein
VFRANPSSEIEDLGNDLRILHDLLLEHHDGVDQLLGPRGASGDVTASLSSTARTVNVSIVLKRGTTVLIRLDDPGKVLSQYEGKSTGAHLLMGISNDARVFRSAPVLSRDAAGRIHQIVIPFNITVDVVVASSFFQLLNAGRPVPKTGISIPITIPSGGARQAPILTLTVTGVNRP